MKVVLLHAWPLDERMWDPQMEVLGKEGYDVTAPHLYGRGASIDGWAGQLLGELEGQFAAVGASMGGYCALALARRAAERMLGVVLVGSRAAADSAERRQARDEQIARLRSQGVPPEVETTVGAEDLAVAQEAIRDRPDATGVVASFGGPLLVCVGDRDKIVPVEEARSVAAEALLGSFELFPGASHFVNVEQSDRFNEVLLKFLAQWQT